MRISGFARIARAVARMVRRLLAVDHSVILNEKTVGAARRLTVGRKQIFHGRHRQNRAVVT